MKSKPSRDRQGETELHAEQVRMLYEAASAAALANAVNAAILVFLLWDVVSHAALQGWLGTMCLVQVSRLALARLYHRLSEPDHGHPYVGPLHWYLRQRTNWDQWYLATVASSGLMWGRPGSGCFPARQPSTNWP